MVPQKVLSSHLGRGALLVPVLGAFQAGALAWLVLLLCFLEEKGPRPALQELWLLKGQQIHSW